MNVFVNDATWPTTLISARPPQSGTQAAGRSLANKLGGGEVGHKALYCSLLFIGLWPLGAYSASWNPQAGSSSNVSAAIKPFIGRWDLTIKTPARELPSWIEISEEQGQPRVVMVGVTDHATPLKKVEFKNGQIEFLSPKGEEGFSADTTFKGKLVGGGLVGTTSSPDGTSWPWTGQRAPTLKRKGTPKWGKPINLFNGKDFTGWRFSDPSRKARWTIEDGTLVSNGRSPEIITSAKFTDFKLHLEFECAPKSNSGVYLRGRYEVQVETDSAAESPSHHTGGVYGFLAPTPELPRRPGVWQSFDITLVGRTVTVVQNGKTIIDHQEIPGITGGALDSHEELPGPIYLQGSEEGRVAYRNIVITPAE
ncbi:MAG: DUF1080 domain-containing protein [Acidobacteriia bacterium]|nr:DUF1080 domain-containing protein [Terriglobia bacterium]